jgi:hypothetical protein
LLVTDGAVILDGSDGLFRLLRLISLRHCVHDPRSYACSTEVGIGDAGKLVASSGDETLGMFYVMNKRYLYAVDTGVL